MNNFGAEAAQSAYPVEDPENDFTRRSDDDEAEPLRVKEMIKLYNFATEKNQELKQAKSFYRATNKSQARIQEDVESCHSAAGSFAADEQSKEDINEKECNDAITTGSFYVTTTEEHTFLRQCLMSNNGKDVSKPVGALEKTYTSSTTIRRTEQGVRIIIDIFCDSDDNTIDVVGGLVETKIPASRILTEFQNHCMGLGPKDTEGEQKASDSSHF
ncbi:uncharacterized protein LOC117896107 [Drosophila subobscura]|uniref:uncharacterized protein LOC117896107 n=1 Tax=Drosophila subobscura TaxID=7241 RepID=UPI00155A97C0|nr:uncharacterized protein LOC117896107 [Drosophila subobscura]